MSKNQVFREKKLRFTPEIREKQVKNVIFQQNYPVFRSKPQGLLRKPGSFTQQVLL